MLLHLSVIAWVPACLFAGYWQVTRAFDGNGLSYLYSVEWPLITIGGVWVWWMLLHIDPEKVGAKAQAGTIEADRVAQAAQAVVVRSRVQDEDPELAAYNDRLAALAAADKPKTWRRA